MSALILSGWKGPLLLRAFILHRKPAPLPGRAAAKVVLSRVNDRFTAVSASQIWDEKREEHGSQQQEAQHGSDTKKAGMNGKKQGMRASSAAGLRPQETLTRAWNCIVTRYPENAANVDLVVDAASAWQARPATSVAFGTGAMAASGPERL
ncbi:hypothetical protein FYK55_24940 [Roseiconus nitratireducens]|uniref:Uncharacterized protein n=1 Tax=Roseiconus nitratireducens TaxID=2605748 RepID=A0A5M6CXN3_9BACT|nr:hypothetical protein [Roseiconus nitratireducens]KAA5539170.1 hypothetical protein FYK55_24940 [Roseiconus nitratireducens]